MNPVIYIESADKTKYYTPTVLEGVEVSLVRRSTAGKLSFTMQYNEEANITQGCAVSLKEGEKGIFFGFIFTMQQDKSGTVKVTAYDQLRYLQNKDTYVYKDKTAAELIKMIADDFRLQSGDLVDTKFKIPSRVEDGVSLFEMIENALDLTMQSTGEIYVLYDDFGKITLQNLEKMKVGSSGRVLAIDADSGENYDYTSSIDSNVYNKIHLYYDNDETKSRDVYIVKDDKNINDWGILQLYEKLEKGEDGVAKAEALLRLYNQKQKKLKLTKMFGDNRVRAGSLILVVLRLGDVRLQNFMLVESVVHLYHHDLHTMDLTLRGGEFNV